MFQLYEREDSNSTVCCAGCLLSVVRSIRVAFSSQQIIGFVAIGFFDNLLPGGQMI